MKLDSFFRVCDDVVLPNGDIVTVRVLSDIEQKIRAEECDRAARAVIRKYKDPEYYENEMGDIERESTDDGIRALIKATRSTQYVVESMSISPRVIPIPDNATEEERQEVEDLREKEIERVKQERQKYVDGMMEKVQEYVKDLERDKLLESLRDVVYIPEAYAARQSAYVLWTIHLSTDRKLTIDFINNVHPFVKNVLYDKYSEVDNVDPFLLQ